jgi:mRNA-degrading endonuclease RelE of RelBE toxin-antitoxin system
MVVNITTHAQRQLKKFSKQALRELKPAILGLAAWPGVKNARKLKNRPDYRLRVGRYRVVFEISEETLYVTQVLLRDDKTYS